MKSPMADDTVSHVSSREFPTYDEALREVARLRAEIQQLDSEIDGLHMSLRLVTRQLKEAHHARAAERK